MSVKKEASGRRSVAIEFTVPGTPEEVWQAIATGPGISAWLMPAELEERDGKPVALKLSFGPGMEPRSRVTAWEPPRVFATEAQGWLPGAPPIASEWRIEAREGGSCTLRIVQSLFADTADWDDQLEAAGSGLTAFLWTLRIYLGHFRGQRSTLMKWMVPAAGTEAEAWETLTTALELQGAGVGHRWTAPAAAPTLGGIVEYLSRGPYDALVRLDEPGPGVAAFGTVDFGGQTMVGMNFYLYGDRAPGLVARETPRWEAWIAERFPPAETATGE